LKGKIMTIVSLGSVGGEVIILRKEATESIK
jgi:hypothetical protein